MSYFLGTGIVSATPSTVVLTQIETMLTDHPAWDFVEEVVEGGFTERIWKCLAAFNSTGADFYVCLMRTTTGIGTANIIVKLAEEYNATTNLASKYAADGDVSGTPSAVDGSTGATTAAWSSTAIEATHVVVTRTTSFNYMVMVTNQGIAMYASPMLEPVYVGTYESYWTDNYPSTDKGLVVTRVGTNDIDGGAAFTRQPAPGYAGVATADAFGGSATDTVTSLIGNVSTTGTTDPLAGVMAVGSKVLLLDALSRPRGELPDDILVFSYSAGVVETDTIDVGTETYAMTGSQFAGLGNRSVWLNTEA